MQSVQDKDDQRITTERHGETRIDTVCEYLASE
jgi:hypothetical protein